ncbi:MAG: amino acid ABC transporter substrate-binding protein [Xanthobacteraceae bacterium]|nr:amino acid ABC transporter substrate-binding protein [Xanthobacteraceae bacterium]MCW5675866.1 amino acid ABC transporter substrate-binding protein [Xanthobacteraceae bacterium]
MIRIFLPALLVFLSAQTVAAGTLKRIQESGIVRLGHRADAYPHSFVDGSGNASGYIVDLCREVVQTLRKQLNRDIKIDYVLVTAQNRFEMVRENKVDLLCEPSSITISRREIVDFSIPTFVDGASVAYRGKEIERFEDFGGKKVGVLAGTTTHELLRSTLSQIGIRAEIVTVNDHRDGIKLLGNGKIDAYFADRAILAYLYSRRDRGQEFQLGRKYFSYETYGLALQIGDAPFRLAVDRTLARLAREGRIEALANKSFGMTADELLRTMIAINSLPD